MKVTNNRAEPTFLILGMNKIKEFILWSDVKMGIYIQIKLFGFQVSLKKFLKSLN